MLNCLAIDLGASSGRLILGTLENKELKLEEIYRFPNTILNINGHSCWNVFQLYSEIKKGLGIFARSGKKADSVGIDSWNVDFVLLGHDSAALGLPYSYRDSRYDGVSEEFSGEVMPLSKLYSLTGLQMLQFNTIFQLYAQKRDRVPALEVAIDLLSISDYLTYLLCDVKRNEFTFASTSQLFDPFKMEYNPDLFRAIGIDVSIVKKLVMPGTILGNLNETICNETGVETIPVVAVASHDTASAIAAVPSSGQNWAYLSSGTWSLMGIELTEPIINDKAYKYNFSNEGGVSGTFRFLKNIGGMWLIERCKIVWAAMGKNYSFNEMVELAGQSDPFQRFVDPDAPELHNPENMVQAIRDLCISSKQPVPETDGDYVRLIYDSLAMKYKFTFNRLKELSPVQIHTMHVIGGGSNNSLLCQLTSDALGVQVVAGPSEATAAGNILVQAMALGQIGSLAEIREVVKNSFTLPIYNPHNSIDRDENYKKFLLVTGLQ